MEIRDSLLYSKDHEWVDEKGNEVKIGISDYAQDSLGDIVYVELPELGTVVVSGEVIGNIESVKAVAELYCPVSGEVVEVNKSLEENPELVNTVPYDEGWIVKLKVESGEVERAGLMPGEAYEAFLENLE